MTLTPTGCRRWTCWPRRSPDAPSRCGSRCPGSRHGPTDRPSSSIPARRRPRERAQSPCRRRWSPRAAWTPTSSPRWFASRGWPGAISRSRVTGRCAANAYLLPGAVVTSLADPTAHPQRLARGIAVDRIRQGRTRRSTAVVRRHPSQRRWSRPVGGRPTRWTTRPSGMSRAARPGKQLEELDDGEVDDTDEPGPVHQPGRRWRLHRQVAEEDAVVRAKVRTSGGGPPGADSPTHRTNSANRGATRCRRRPRPPPGRPSTSSPDGFTYPEWDVASQDGTGPTGAPCTRSSRPIEAAATGTIDDAIGVRAAARPARDGPAPTPPAGSG